MIQFCSLSVLIYSIVIYKLIEIYCNKGRIWWQVSVPRVFTGPLVGVL